MKSKVKKSKQSKCKVPNLGKSKTQWVMDQPVSARDIDRALHC